MLLKFQSLMLVKFQDFPFDKYFVKKDQNRMDTYSLYAIYAAMEAIENSGLTWKKKIAIVLV